MYTTDLLDQLQLHDLQNLFFQHIPLSNTRYNYYNYNNYYKNIIKFTQDNTLHVNLMYNNSTSNKSTGDQVYQSVPSKIDIVYT